MLTLITYIDEVPEISNCKAFTALPKLQMF